MSTVGDDDRLFAQRLARVRAALGRAGVDALLASVGPELPWLTGYEAMPLERLTLLVVPRNADAVLIVPRLEAPRVLRRPAAFRVRAWEETEDPVAIAAELLGGAERAVVGDRMWARFVLELQRACPRLQLDRAQPVVGPLRACKDPAEVAALRDAAAAADRVAAALQGGEVPLVGRSEAEVARELGRRLIAEGHRRVNFAIVASGPNAASPHHSAAERVLGAGDVVVCDFGGTYPGPGGVGYCSDITRCVSVGEPPAEVADAYEVLRRAQARARQAAVVGVAAEHVDATARRVLQDAGLGEWFLHRTGHGIGIEEHEDPYLVAGNVKPLAAGNAFSVEPGVYRAGRWGLRLEDILVATEAGPELLNRADRALVALDG